MRARCSELISTMKLAPVIGIGRIIVATPHVHRIRQYKNLLPRVSSRLIPYWAIDLTRSRSLIREKWYSHRSHTRGDCTSCYIYRFLSFVYTCKRPLAAPSFLRFLIGKNRGGIHPLLIRSASCYSYINRLNLVAKCGTTPGTATTDKADMATAAPVWVKSAWNRHKS